MSRGDFTDDYDRGRGRDDDYDRGRDDDYGRIHDRDDDYDFRRRDVGDIPNYLAPAILCTLFCCTIGGIVAIVYAAQVNGKIAAGDYHGAREASNSARTWCWVCFAIGIVVQPLVFYFNFSRRF
jgi:hypothetical protein